MELFGPVKTCNLTFHSFTRPRTSKGGRIFVQKIACKPSVKEMDLISVYQAHVALCARMAASAGGAELKEQWLGLAEVWRQKAEASAASVEASSEVVSPPVAPSRSPVADPTPGVTPILTSHQAPTTAYKLPVPLHEPTPQDRPSPETIPTNGHYDQPIDDSWMALLAEIRRK